MTISQIGIFEHGTFGFPVQIQLSNEPVSISGATAIHLDCKRPGATTYAISRDLTVPDDIVDSNLGVIKWPVLTGELTVAGHYRIIVTITFGSSAALTVAGQMRVS